MLILGILDSSPEKVESLKLSFLLIAGCLGAQQSTLDFMVLRYLRSDVYSLITSSLEELLISNNLAYLDLSLDFSLFEGSPNAIIKPVFVNSG